jgi:UMF1 family MFS transporter
VGYLGSYVAVILGLLLKTQDKPRLFLAIAAAFLLFSIPCFLWVKERGNPRPRKIDWAMVRDSTSQTLRTLRSGKDYPGLVRFLVGRVFYTDSINTVISIMALYTVNVAVSTGMSEADGQKKAQLIMLFAITFAIAGGFFWGWLTDRLGPKRTLNLVLIAWIGVFSFAGIVGIVGLPLWCLFLVAASAGFSLGGIWASDRPYMLRLTPPARVGEFYGLYGMVGRFSAITGPVLWALSTYLTIQVLHLAPRVGQGISVIVLMLMVVLSYAILQPISDAPRQWRPEDLHH